MPQADRDQPPEKADGGLIWARDDVVVTSGVNRDGLRTHYIKITETEEIFELGDAEYSVWQEFAGGQSLEHAEHAVVERLGSEFDSSFRSLVAELAIRGLLLGAIPDKLLDDFSADPRAQEIRLQHQIDPDDRETKWGFYRFPLFEPNRPFSLLARWFGFMRHAVWPIGFAAFLGGLVLIKHSTELYQDSPPQVLAGYGIPHLLIMLLTVKLARNVVIATAIRYYGARIRVFSIDFLFGFWPRFHVDKRGLLRLKRTPQLWGHSSPSFARLAFFGFGALGWWWFHGDGTTKSAWCLMLCQAGLIELIISTLPLRFGGKNEMYYWCCAYLEEPFLRERAHAALRGLFSREIGAFDLTSIERTALIAYGLSMVASLLFVAYFVINLLMAWTGHFRGAGLALFLTICAVLGLWMLMQRSRRQKRMAAVLEVRQQRRSSGRRRRASELDPLTEN